MKKPACNLSVLLLASFALGQLGPVAADPSPAVQPTAPAAAPAASPTPAPTPAPAPVPAPPAAAPSTESITTTIQLPADKHLAATAILSAMEQKMSAAKAISFVTNVSFSIPTMLGKPASFTCSGTADKSGNYFISIIRQDGSQENVYFDGQKFTVFNSATSRY